MKNNYFIIIFLVFLTQIASSQVLSNWTDIDTIQVYSDKILVDYRYYSDSNLIEHGRAYHYPATLEIRKSKWLPRIFKTTVPADSIVLHGIVKKNWKYGKYRIGKYVNGHKTEMTYYNAEGIEISYHDFYGAMLFHGDPEKGTSIFLIHGNKKKK